MFKFNLSIPELDTKEIQAATKAIKTGWISTAGSDVVKFEKKICEKTKSKYSLALNSGTSAIHLALIASNVEKSDEVLVQSLTYVATINPILYLGASPIFFDVDDKFNMKLENVIEFLKNNTFIQNKKCINKKSRKIIKAIIITHLWGNSQNISKIRKICKTRKISIIEDSAESFGTKIKIGKKLISSGCQGDFGCYSFNGNKIVTTGSGGAIVTNIKKSYSYLNYLATQARDDSFHYIHNEMGFNYKLNNLLSCLGISQLKKLNFFIKRKKKIHKQYVKELDSIDGIKIFKPNSNILSNYWFNIITFKNLSNSSLEKLKSICNKNKIEIRQVWRPAHTHKYLTKYETFKISNSFKLYKNSFCLPSSLKLDEKNINFINQKIKKFCKNYL
jgi:perosamine synthetase